MTAVIGAALIFGGLAVILAGTFRYGWQLTAFDAIGNAMSLAGNILQHNWILTALWIAVVVSEGWGMWRRRKRKRAARELGAKSRALIAALVARVRESATPRPVLRPAPGGAR